MIGDIQQARVLILPHEAAAHQRQVNLWLNGKTLELHSTHDILGPIREYNFGKRYVSPPSPPPDKSHTLHVRQGSEGPSQEQLIDYVVACGPLTHLVINCHGAGVLGGTQVRLGQGFDRSVTNSSPWSKLAGRVQYIWFQSCSVGADAEQCGKIAAQTGAWVTAPRLGTPDRDPSVPFEHIDYQYPSICGHFLHQNREPFSMKTRNDFFRRARHSPDANVADSLYFNVASLGPRFGRP